MDKLFEKKKYKENIKNGKIKIKNYYIYQGEPIFKIPKGMNLILTSDLHTATGDIMKDLIKKKIINKNTIVISTGDMAGNGTFGGNGDPYKDYVNIKNNCHSFFFIQGNHDYKNDNCKNLQNSDGTFCHVDDRVENSIIGLIGGIDGIMVDECREDKNKHKFREIDYSNKLRYILKKKPDILLSHQPIEKRILEKVYLPKFHLCGHYHIDNYVQIYDNHVMINLDGKIIEFIG